MYICDVDISEGKTRWSTWLLHYYLEIALSSDSFPFLYVLVLTFNFFYMNGYGIFALNIVVKYTTILCALE